MSRRKRPSNDGEKADLGPDIRRVAIVSRAPEDASAVRIIRPPTVEPASWRDPEDLDRNRRVPRIVSGVRAADPLLAMHHRGGLVTIEHLAAATKLADAYETGVLGAQEGRGRLVGGGTGPGFAAGTYPAEVRLAALGTFRAAMRAVGVRSVPLVAHVVLGVPDPMRRDVAAYAERHGLDEKVVRGLLIAALDALVGFFQPAPDAIREAIETLIDGGA